MTDMERKIEWLANATNEELLKQFELSSDLMMHGFEICRKDSRYTLDGIREDYELVRTEVLRRMK